MHILSDKNYGFAASTFQDSDQDLDICLQTFGLRLMEDYCMDPNMRDSPLFDDPNNFNLFKDFKQLKIHLVEFFLYI